MIKRLKKHHISFRNAWNGIKYAFLTQPNFSVHLFFSLAALLGGFYFGISNTEFAVIIMVIVFGLGTEMINTAIESVTDLVTSEWRKEAKIAKDVSAGTMLVVAIGAVIVSVYIFLPRILTLF